jgi:hypothetical protein
MSKTAITSPELRRRSAHFPKQSKSMVSSSSADRSPKTQPLARWSRGALCPRRSASSKTYRRF